MTLLIIPYYSKMISSNSNRRLSSHEASSPIIRMHCPGSKPSFTLGSITKFYLQNKRAFHGWTLSGSGCTELLGVNQLWLVPSWRSDNKDPEEHQSAKWGWKSSFENLPKAAEANQTERLTVPLFSPGDLSCVCETSLGGNSSCKKRGQPFHLPKDGNV